MTTSQVRRGDQQDGIDYEIAEEEEYYVTRPHTSVRRYKQPVRRDTSDDYAPEQSVFIQRRRAGNTTPATNRIISKAVDPSLSLKRHHVKVAPWLAVVVGMLAMLTVVVGIRAFGSWWQTHQDDTTYGYPRTYQTDFIVGHLDGSGKPSHFIFLNMHGRVEIIEFPGGDSTHAMIYTGPSLFGDKNDLIPVTGKFEDVNGDQRPDMLVYFQGQTLVYINEGTKFRPLQPGEHVNIPA